MILAKRVYLKIFQPKPSNGNNSYSFFAMHFYHKFFLLHWKKAIFLIIKVKVMADLTGRSYMYLNSSIPALLCPKQHYLPSLGTNFYLNSNSGY